MKKKIAGKETKYWLWVAKPLNWLDKKGNDRSELDPQKNYKGGEWSCHKETKRGDLVFLWRSRRELSEYLRSNRINKKIPSKSDIGYLIRAESKADGPYENEDFPYWCSYKPLYKFDNPVTIEDFKDNPILLKSLPYKVHFVKNSFPLTEIEWNEINKIAMGKNPGYKKFYESLVGKKILTSPKEKSKKEEQIEPQSQSEEKPYKRKYGAGGEGEEHKKLKEWVANNPQRIELFDMQGYPKIEYQFISGDTADILFECEDGKFVVVEIETDVPEPGFYQALKYKILKCAEAKIDLTSSDVRAILVAWAIPDSIKELCNQYNVEFHEIRREEYNQ